MADGPDRIHDFGDVRVEVFVTGTWRENCYLVTDRSISKTALIDPGDEAGRLILHIAAESLRVSLILCTHAHFDHVGALEQLCRHTELPFHLHRDDLRLLKRAPLYALSFDKRTMTVPTTVEVFDDRARFELGEFGFEAIQSPGHTPGSVCFRHGPLLFAGDTILHSKRGRTDLPGGDAAALDASITALLDAFEDDLVILPGHGEPWTLYEARRWWAQCRGAPS
jgi:glyoxylase-like metal-dependent hydrolase (beta-lactamase superfamily II)